MRCGVSGTLMDKVHILSFSLVAVCALTTSIASADRVVVIPLESPGRTTPTLEAERLSADLAARGHRVVATSDAIARIATGNDDAGADWAMQLTQSIGAA